MKNTKIMAVLVVLLAAMLFVGAASAATFDVDLTPNETIYHDGQKVQINMTWTSAIDPTNMSYVNQSVNVSYGGSEYSFGAWDQCCLNCNIYC